MTALYFTIPDYQMFIASLEIKKGCPKRFFLHVWPIGIAIFLDNLPGNYYKWIKLKIVRVNFLPNVPVPVL